MYLRPLSSRSPRFLCRGHLAAILGAVLLGSMLTGCSCEEDVTTVSDPEARDPLTGLTRVEAQEVLVKVGDRNITLGDYAATLLRMDRFERLRYQTEESQKKLLDEMIEVEILAQEAKRRGLDKDPEVQLRLQQALRDEVLRKLEIEQPGLEEFSEREVREYYEAHRSEFKEPERRRVQVIRTPKQAAAEKVIESLDDDPSGANWGKLALEYSSDRTNLEKDEAHELAGDLGFVSAPGQERGGNLKIPDEVRAAVFEVEKVGDVVSRPIAAEGNFFVVRMAGISPARDRSLKEAERTIRVELRRLKFLEAEKKLEAELRAKYPVVIDEKAIAAYQPPLQKGAPAADPSPAVKPK